MSLCIIIDKGALKMQKLKAKAEDLFHGGSFTVGENNTLILPLKPYNFRAVQILAE